MDPMGFCLFLFSTEKNILDSNNQLWLAKKLVSEVHRFLWCSVGLGLRFVLHDSKESKHHNFQAEAKEVVSTSMYAASGGVEVSAWDLNDLRDGKVKKRDF